MWLAVSKNQDVVRTTWAHDISFRTDPHWEYLKISHLKPKTMSVNSKCVFTGGKKDRKEVLGLTTVTHHSLVPQFFLLHQRFVGWGHVSDHVKRTLISRTTIWVKLMVLKLESLPNSSGVPNQIVCVFKKGNPFQMYTFGKSKSDFVSLSFCLSLCYRLLSTLKSKRQTLLTLLENQRDNYSEVNDMTNDF